VAQEQGPEEQQFDFGLAEPAAAALERRVRQISAVAASSRTARRTPVRSTRGATMVPAAIEATSDTAAPVADGAPVSVADGTFVATDGQVEGAHAGAWLATDQLAAPSRYSGGDDDGSGRPAEESLTVAAFYDRIKRALAQAFPAEVWVTGEIRGFRESRGHRYIELADAGADAAGRAAAQQLEVVCWSRDWPPVARALADAGVDLEVGRVVRVRGRVSVWEGGSKLRFTLTSLDVEALLGGIAAARRRLLQMLDAEGLLAANARLGVPLVPLRIGLVTSPGSEAHRDFAGQLDQSGFAFEIVLEPSLVQGAEAPRQIVAALSRLAGAEPDLVVVVRGGGARGDLAAFDSEEVARAIAAAPFPVWTGIGHTGDRSVADEVAQRALITPTACGEAVVAAVADYWGLVVERAGTLAALAGSRLDVARQSIHAAAGAVTRGARHQLDRRSDEIAGARQLAMRAARSGIERETGKLAAAQGSLGSAALRVVDAAERDRRRFDQVLRAYDPRRQIERGWSLTRDASGRPVRSVADLVRGATITTTVHDGEIVSVVQEAGMRAEAGQDGAGPTGPGDGRTTGGRGDAGREEVGT
jgi:exodeoxyribonuclease VII large subunit